MKWVTIPQYFNAILYICYPWIISMWANYQTAFMNNLCLTESWAGAGPLIVPIVMCIFAMSGFPGSWSNAEIRMKSVWLRTVKWDKATGCFNGVMITAVMSGPPAALMLMCAGESRVPRYGSEPPRFCYWCLATVDNLMFTDGSALALSVRKQVIASAPHWFGVSQFPCRRTLMVKAYNTGGLAPSQ